MLESRKAPGPEVLPPDLNYLSETRTLFAAVRTGLAVAGVGPLVSQFLLVNWPSWVVVTLTMPFVIIGYTIVWSALHRHAVIRRRAAVAGHELGQPAWLYLPLTLVLQVLMVVVLGLYLVRR